MRNGTHQVAFGVTVNTTPDQRQKSPTVRTECRTKQNPNNHCQRPRSCMECLSIHAEDSSMECFLDGNTGSCWSKDDLIEQKVEQYVLSLHNISSNTTKEPEYKIFSSKDFRYCESHDTACGICGSNPNISICIGVDGCICSSTCDSIEWNNSCLPPSSSSSSSSSSTSLEESTGSALRRQWFLITLELAFVCLQFVILCIIWKKRRQEIRWQNVREVFLQRRHQHQTQRQSHGLLQLTGWFQWHEEMQEKENEMPVSCVNLEPTLPQKNLQSPSQSIDISTSIL